MGDALGLPGIADESVQHLIGHTVADINLAAQNSANRHQHLLGGLLLHDVAVGSGAQRALGVERFVEHRENQHRQVRVARANILEQIQAVGSVERNVHHDQVGLQFLDPAQCGAGLFGIAANGQIRLAIDQQRQPLADDRMIVDDEKQLLLDGLHFTSPRLVDDRE